MKDEDADAIWSLQPFRDPTAPHARVLIDLALLSNMDKHQLCLPMVVAVSNEVAPVTWAESPLGGQGDMQINEGAPLRPHVALARIRAYSGTDQLFFNAGIRQKIVYGGPGSLVGRRELREIRSHRVGIVESFAPSREGKVPRSWYRFWYPPDVI